MEKIKKELNCEIILLVMVFVLSFESAGVCLPASLRVPIGNNSRINQGMQQVSQHQEFFDFEKYFKDELVEYINSRRGDNGIIIRNLITKVFQSKENYIKAKTILMSKINELLKDRKYSDAADLIMVLAWMGADREIIEFLTDLNRSNIVRLIKFSSARAIRYIEDTLEICSQGNAPPQEYKHS